METLRTLLASKRIVISLRYYGVQDLGTGCDVKTIVDNPEIFDDLYLKYPLLKIEDIDDYYMYFLSQKIAMMSEIAPKLIHEEHKEKIKLLASEAKSAVDKIGPGPAIKFINSNVCILFDNKKSSNDIRSATIDFMAKYAAGIDQSVFYFLCKDYGYLLIDRFDDFERVFEAHPDLFSLLFPTGKLEEIDAYRFDTILRIWSHILSKNKSALKDSVKKDIPTLFEDIKKLSNAATIDNIMQIEGTIREFNLFLRKIKSPMANEFSKYAKAAESLLTRNLQERGERFAYKIPVEEIVNRWKETENWEVRLLSLTHDLKKGGEQIEAVSRLSAPSGAKDGLLDFVSTNIPTDDFFTMSHQQELSIIASIETGSMARIIGTLDTFRDYLSLIFSAVKFIAEATDANEENLQQDVSLLADLVQLVVEDQDAAKTATKPLSYGASMYICAFSEKLLRTVYTYIVKDECYVPTNKATLGELLNLDNYRMVEIFGENHIKNLAFYLSQTQPNGIGHNYRNSLAHWANITADNLTPMFMAQLLWLFTDILNTVFWYFFRNSMRGDNNHDQL